MGVSQLTSEFNVYTARSEKKVTELCIGYSLFSDCVKALHQCSRYTMITFASYQNYYNFLCNATFQEYLSYQPCLGTPELAIEDRKCIATYEQRVISLNSLSDKGNAYIKERYCQYIENKLDCIENGIKSFCGVEIATWKRSLEYQFHIPFMKEIGCPNWEISPSTNSPSRNVNFTSESDIEDDLDNTYSNTTSVSLPSSGNIEDKSFLDRHSSVLIYCASGLLGLMAILVAIIVLRKIGKQRHWGLPKLLVTSVQGLYKRNNNQPKLSEITFENDKRSSSHPPPPYDKHSFTNMDQSAKPLDNQAFQHNESNSSDSQETIPKSLSQNNVIQTVF